MRFILNSRSVKNPGLLLAGAIVAILAFAYYLNSLVPLHSDDFVFGVGAETLRDLLRLEYQLYMNWGGRTIVHMLARLCLQLPLYLQDLLNSLAFLSVVGLAALAQQGYTLKGFCSALLLSFALYICFHPALGQATFWIVGSAAYLWPLIFLGLQYHLLSNASRFNRSAPGMFSVFLLGLVCGWSVEGQAVGGLLLTLCFYLTNIREVRDRWLYISVLVGNLLGALALFAAPGNKQRLVSSGFTDIGEAPLIDTFSLALLESVPSITYSLIGVLATLAALYALTGNRKAFRRDTLCPLIASLGAAYVLSLAPYLAERALSPAFFLMLLTINSGIKHVDFHQWKKIAAVSGILLFLFSLSIVEELTSGYLSLSRQHKIRVAVIVQAMEEDRQPICTPEWYTEGIIGERLAFDGFRPESKAPFYGSAEVKHLNMGYDYSRHSYKDIYQALYVADGHLCQ